MKTTLIRYILLDIVQNKIVVAYTVFLLAVSFGLFNLSEQPAKGMISLLNVVLIVVPLVSLVFATIHLYNAGDFIEMLAAQPLRRSTLLWSQFVGLSIALMAAVGLGIGLPVLLYGADGTGLALLLAALALTLVFVALAFWAAVATRDKARGIGVALLLWFYFALLYDALVLFILFGFADYPLEKATIALVSLNPIDLGRILVLMQMDISALMGYTGALFRSFFGTGIGVAYALTLLLVWVAVPVAFAQRIFRKKDL